MNSDTVPDCSRVVVTFDCGKVKPRVVFPTNKKGTKPMNYRDFDHNNPCLPAEAYPYLWAAFTTTSEPTPTLFDKIRAALRRLRAVLPALAAATLLPVADQFPAHPEQDNLVWVQPKNGKRPPAAPTLPLPQGNPYSL